MARVELRRFPSRIVHRTRETHDHERQASRHAARPRPDDARRRADRPRAGIGGARPAWRRRGEPEDSRPRAGTRRRCRRPHAAHGRARRVRAGARLRPRDLQPAQEPARPRLDAGDLRADLRDLQDVPHHPGQVHPPARGLHRHHHRALLRLPAALRGHPRADHPALQPHRHRGQLWRGVVRHPHQHLRQLADGVRESSRPGLSGLRHPAQGRHVHRHAADQRRAVPDAVHPALHPGRLRGAMLHRLRHRRVARRGRAAHRRWHLHEDRGHRLGPHEDRVQHQRGRRAQSRCHRRLHG